MTDLEEQKMIEQAKSGDPKAQFELSQWARQMSILEPNEERWNRLAAKCLVDAAKAGYEPAKQMVQNLISGEAEAVPAAEKESAPNEESESSGYDWNFQNPDEVFRVAEESAAEDDYYDDEDYDDYYDDEDYDEAPVSTADKILDVLKSIGAALKKFGLFAAAAIAGLVKKIKGSKAADKGGSHIEARGAEELPEEYEDDERPVSRRAAAPKQKSGGFAAWIEDNWRVLRVVCIAVCVVLAVLIVVLLLPGKEKTEVVEVTPTVAPTIAPTPEPTPEPFPNEATLLEISNNTTLLYRPGDSAESDYLPASTMFTVVAESYENLRQGPGSNDYPDVIMTINEGETVTAYAKYTVSDSVVWYLINYGGTWGWMYGESLG